MELISNIVLNMQAPSYSTVYSPHGQTLARFVRASLMDGATKWTIPAGALVVIRYAKPDGTIGFYDTLEDDSSAYSYEGNVITFGLAAQALTVPGTVLMQLDFYSDANDRLTTFTFQLKVSGGVFSDDVLISEDYIIVLTAKLSEAALIFEQIKAAYGAPRTAATAEAMTDHSLIYVYTGTTGGGLTNGHWYYWNGSAWTDGGNYNSTGFTTDKTLHVTDAAADSKTVGDAIAAYYNSATTYEVGDYCLYNGVLYRCTTGGADHTPGSVSTYWTATNIMSEAGSGVGNSIATAFSSSSSTSYAVGDYVVYQRGLYRCTGATTGGTWDSTKWTAAILADDVSDLKNTLGNAMQLNNCTGYASYPYTFVSGKKYTLAILDGKVRASTRATETGAEIDLIFSTITDAPAIKTFTASANASYLRVSVETTNPPASVCIFENISVNGCLADLELKTKADLADFSESPTTINATGYDNYAYSIKAGKSYTFRAIEGSCRAYTRATADGENIDTIIGTSKQAPYSVTFTATANANYVRVLADVPSKVSIVNASSIYDAIDEQQTDIDNIKHDLYSKQSFETSGIAYDSFPCQIVSGKEYVVVLNQGSMRLYTRATADGANIDTIIPASKAAPYYAKFTASANASYLRVLADNAVQFDVYDTADIIGLIEKLNYINFSKTELGLDINAPYPQKPANSSSDSDFNAETVTSAQIYSYLDSLASKYPQVLTKEYLGKDSTNTYDINRYVFCDSQRSSYYATIFIGANEHGPSSDPRECAIICCRFLTDLCQAYAKTNPYLNFLKKYFKFVIIPIVNPYGFDTDHRNNGNDVNINRNYNTPGWSSVQDADKGASAGSEVETQYVMNTISAYNPQVALDVHCHGYVNPLADKLMLINAANLVMNRQGLTDVTKLMKRDYDISCDVAYTQAANSSEGEAYYDYVGVHGALIELLAREGTTSENLIHTATILEADYTFMLRVLDALITDYNPLYSFDQEIF